MNQLWVTKVVVFQVLVRTSVNFFGYIQFSKLRNNSVEKVNIFEKVSIFEKVGYSN